MNPGQGGKMLTFSKSKILTFFSCPKSYYFHYLVTGIPKKTTLPLLCGSEVHQHIEQFYKKPAKPRPFYFQTQRSAIGAWFGRWARAIENPAVPIIDLSEEQVKKYGEVGAICTANYWKGNIGKARPLAVEEPFNYLWRPGIKITGIVDQLRIAPIPWIKGKRPELVLNGELISGYDPVVILDLKTNRESYDTRAFNLDPSPADEARMQHALHEDIQPTFYTWLYEKCHRGQKPVGFIWYHLRSNKFFFTFREERDYTVIEEIIDHLVDNLDTESFPKKVGLNCRYCFFTEHCRGERRLVVSLAEEPGEASAPLSVIFNPAEANLKGPKQLKLKFKKKKNKIVLHYKQPKGGKMVFLKERHVEKVCQRGDGEATCRYLIWRRGKHGCAKLDPQERELRDIRLKEGAVKAQGDNCDGRIELGA